MARLVRQSLSVADPFGCGCLTSYALLRFHFPLIEPDVRISRIRLSDQVHPEGLRSFRSTQGLTRPMASYKQLRGIGARHAFPTAFVNMLGLPV